MSANLGFGCKVFVSRGTKSNVFTTMKVENNIEAAKAKTNEVVNPMGEYEPSNVDAPPKGKFVYILVF